MTQTQTQSKTQEQLIFFQQQQLQHYRSSSSNNSNSKYRSIYDKYYRCRSCLQYISRDIPIEDFAYSVKYPTILYHKNCGGYLASKPKKRMRTK